MPQPFKINWTCNLTSWSSGTVGCNSDGSGGLEYLEKLQTFTTVVILTKECMYVGGIPLIDKHWIMITYSGIGSYGCKYVHYFNEDSLEKKYDRIISATDTS